MSQNHPNKTSLSWKERAIIEEQINSINYNKHEKSLNHKFNSIVNE
jgi:hypothetical protein